MTIRKITRRLAFSIAAASIALLPTSLMASSHGIDLSGKTVMPLIMNVTPSVYATESGGAKGDSRINVRGFDQSNTAVMINGARTASSHIICFSNLL